MGENRKVGLTGVNWFLSISGIILLSLFIILPPIFRIVFKEDVVVENNEPIVDNNVQDNTIDDSDYMKVTCIKSTVTSDYNQSKSVILAHENNLLTIFTIETNTIFSLATKENESMFTDSKLSCTNNKKSLTGIIGFNYNCDIDTNSIKEVTKYDLTTFEVSSLPLDKTSLFTPSYTFNQDITVVQNLLINDGYTCQ